MVDRNVLLLAPLLSMPLVGSLGLFAWHKGINTSGGKRSQSSSTAGGGDGKPVGNTANAKDSFKDTVIGIVAPIRESGKFEFTRRWLGVMLNVADVLSDFCLIAVFVDRGQDAFVAMFTLFIAATFAFNVGCSLFKYFVYIRPDDPNPTRAGIRLFLSTLFHVRAVEEALFPADAHFPDRLLRFMKYAEIIFEAVPMAVLSYFLVLWNPSDDIAIAVLSFSVSVISSAWGTALQLGTFMSEIVSDFEQKYTFPKQVVLATWSLLDLVARVFSLGVFLLIAGVAGMFAVIIFIVNRALWHRYVLGNRSWSWSNVFLCLSDILRWVHADWLPAVVSSQNPLWLDAISWIESFGIALIPYFVVRNDAAFFISELQRSYTRASIAVIVAAHVLKFVLGCVITRKLFPDKTLDESLPNNPQAKSSGPAPKPSPANISARMHPTQLQGNRVPTSAGGALSPALSSAAFSPKTHSFQTVSYLSRLTHSVNSTPASSRSNSVMRLPGSVLGSVPETSSKLNLQKVSAGLKPPPTALVSSASARNVLSHSGSRGGDQQRQILSQQKRSSLSRSAGNLFPVPYSQHAGQPASAGVRSRPTFATAGKVGAPNRATASWRLSPATSPSSPVSAPTPAPLNLTPPRA